MRATGAPKMASISAIVIRCGCSAEEKAKPNWHGAHGVVCPKPSRIEDRGVVSYWHRNPLKRLGWSIRQFWKGLTQ